MLQRAVYTMREQGMSQREVAAAVGVGQGTVNAMYHAERQGNQGNVSSLIGTDQTRRLARPHQVIPEAQHDEIKRRVAEGETTVSVAKDLGVSKQRISQIARKEPTKRRSGPRAPSLPPRQRVIVEPPQGRRASDWRLAAMSINEMLKKAAEMGGPEDISAGWSAAELATVDAALAQLIDRLTQFHAGIQQVKARR